MSARVVAYSAHPDDTHLTLMIECRECAIEWGWTRDLPAASDRLDTLAAVHNAEHHSTSRRLSDVEAVQDLVERIHNGTADHTDRTS